MIMVIPELDMVAVITSANPSIDLNDAYFLRALKSSYWAARPNPDGVADLDNLTTRIALPSECQSTLTTGSARMVSGSRYVLTNEQDIPHGAQAPRAFTVQLPGESPSPNILIEFDERNLSLALEDRGNPAFSDVGDYGERPDKKSQFAATAYWAGHDELILDIHEIGYPAKERWVVSFQNDDIASVVIEVRGAIQVSRSFSARRFDS